MSIFAILAATLLATQQPSVTIISVGDGDTFRATKGTQTVTIRLACVDAPELAQQPFGNQARDRLSQLLPQNQQVQIREIDRDRYGRIVAEIFSNGRLINLQLVREGQAVIYPQYFSSCSGNSNQYDQAQSYAQQRRLGFWNQSSPVMPWDFRRTRTAVPPTPPNRNCSPAYPGVCIPPPPPDLNCAQISQRNFRVLPPDPHNFDRNRDDIGCES